MAEGSKVRGAAAGRRLARKVKLQQAIAAQRRWIEEHGGSLSGYVARYGDPDLAALGFGPVYGDGGRAIYAADKAELDRLLQELEEVQA